MYFTFLTFQYFIFCLSIGIWLSFINRCAVFPGFEDYKTCVQNLDANLCFSLFSIKFTGGSDRAAAAPQRVVCAEYSAPGAVDCSYRRRLNSGILLNILPWVPLTARTDADSIQVYCWIFCPGYSWLLVQTQTQFRYIAEYSAPGTVDCSYRHRLNSGILLNILPRVPLTARTDANSIQVYCWILWPRYSWLLEQTQAQFRYIAEYSAPGTVDCSYRRRLNSGILLNILPRVPLTARTDTDSIQVYCWIFCPGNRWLLVQTQAQFRYIAEYSAPGTVDCSYWHRLHLASILLNILHRVPLTALIDADSIQVYCWIFCPGDRWLLAQTQAQFRYIAEYSALGTAGCSYKRRLSGILLNILPRIPLTTRTDADSI